jgi:two-component system, sensor histidine kinase
MARRRVLVVEDDADSCDSLHLLLECWGHEVQTDDDGREGLERALAWRPEVAVVDIGLPLLDGYEVARRVRAALGGGVRLIALTAHGDRRRALDAGFDHHLLKPADPDELARLLGAGCGTGRPPRPPRSAASAARA